MALDDFTTAAEGEEAASTGASDAFSQREALDEDLFDFPPVAFGNPVNDAELNNPPAALPNEEAKQEAGEEQTVSPMAEADAHAAGSEAEVDPATTHLIDLGDGDCEWSRLIEGSRAHECAKTNGGRVTCQTSECDPGMCGSGKA